MRETPHRSPRRPTQLALSAPAPAQVKGRPRPARFPVALAARAARAALAAAALAGCEPPAGAAPQPGAAPDGTAQVAAAVSATARAVVVEPAAPRAEAAAPAPSRRDELTLLAGGDVCFGRALGQALLRDPARDPFAPIAGLLASADVRFVNLESQLSDQRGETQSPRMHLVFTGPPAGADALARAGITVVSTANNHMWDYGRDAFLETLAHLERAGVAHAGGGRTSREAYAPIVIERDGFRLAVLAVTDIWNQGNLHEHAGRLHVASADPHLLDASVRAARSAPGIDAVVVSYHGGGEYIEAPMPRVRVVARTAIDAGADAFIGHHPHVVQGVEIRRGRPIFYSLGNLLMRPNPARRDTDLGALARLKLRRGAPPAAELCPVRGDGIELVSLAHDPRRAETEAAFLDRLRRVRAHVTAAPELGPFAADGCAPLTPRAAPPR